MCNINIFPPSRSTQESVSWCRWIPEKSRCRPGCLLDFFSGALHSAPSLTAHPTHSTCGGDGRAQDLGGGPPRCALGIPGEEADLTRGDPATPSTGPSTPTVRKEKSLEKGPLVWPEQTVTRRPPLLDARSGAPAAAVHPASVGPGGRRLARPASWAAWVP